MLKKIKRKTSARFNKSKIENQNKIRLNPYFDKNYYLQNNLDLFVSGVEPLEHFERYGQFEGRDPSRTISSDWLQFKYGEKSNNPYRFICDSVGTDKNLSPNPLFDSQFYVQQLGGTGKLNNLTPYDHYLNFGIHENLKPNSWLNLNQFAESNPWFFNTAKSNFEKFVNLFEIIRNNEIFNQYLCFVVENNEGERFQITSELFNSYLKTSEQFPKNSDKNYLSGWEIIDQIFTLAAGNFSDLESMDAVKTYPPKLIGQLETPTQSNFSNVVSYCHWSSDGSVAEWIAKPLKEFKSLGFEIVFNTNLSISALPEFVRDNCQVLLQRSNSGHDFESHLITQTWLIENQAAVDRLVLANDSFFFPVSSTEQLRSELDNPKSPFWGFTENFWGQSHLQSYFLVLEKPLIDNYFAFIRSKLNKWKYISKSGLINNIELCSHDFAKQNGVNPHSLFSGVDPTFDSWDKLQDFGIPILKIHLIRKLLTSQPGDTELLKMKLLNVFEDSSINIDEILSFCRKVEVNANSGGYWYNSH